MNNYEIANCQDQRFYFSGWERSASPTLTISQTLLNTTIKIIIAQKKTLKFDFNILQGS